ncbi:MAG TPA: M50 family metallopeptidase [Myxococcales bacterium]|nr:M50 family metallopeptidase [Myxococcales bacterium]
MRYLLATFLLGLLVALHELGHLVSARLCRMKVESFAVGFGPPLLAFRRRGVHYSLRAIPFGGFVRIAGMAPATEIQPAPGSFTSRPRWQRAVVLVAGSLANALCAVALLFGLYHGGYRVPVPNTVGEVAPGSEAARVQLRPGDVVMAVDGQPLRDWSALAEAVAERGGPLALTIRRGEQVLEVRATPRPDEEGIPRLGVAQLYAFRSLTNAEAAGYAFRHSVALAWDGLKATWALLRGQPGVSLMGPIGIARRTAEASATGFEPMLGLLAAISIALAVFNLLPVPGLDGGRLLFLGIAGIRGKPADPRVEAVASALGMLLLFGAAIWVSVRDVRGRAREPGPAPAEVDAGAGVDGGVDAGADAGAAPDAGARAGDAGG